MGEGLGFLWGAGHEYGVGRRAAAAARACALDLLDHPVSPGRAQKLGEGFGADALAVHAFVQLAHAPLADLNQPGGRVGVGGPEPPQPAAGAAPVAAPGLGLGPLVECRQGLGRRCRAPPGREHRAPAGRHVVASVGARAAPAGVLDRVRARGVVGVAGPGGDRGEFGPGRDLVRGLVGRGCVVAGFGARLLPARVAHGGVQRHWPRGSGLATEGTVGGLDALRRVVARGRMSGVEITGTGGGGAGICRASCPGLAVVGACATLRAASHRRSVREGGASGPVRQYRVRNKTQPSPPRADAPTSVVPWKFPRTRRANGGFFAAEVPLTRVRLGPYAVGSGLTSCIGVDPATFARAWRSRLAGNRELPLDLAAALVSARARGRVAGRG